MHTLALDWRISTIGLGYNGVIGQTACVWQMVHGRCFTKRTMRKVEEVWPSTSYKS